MLAVAESIVVPAIARRESRGAHVRLDYPEQAEVAVARFLNRTDDGWSMTERDLTAVTA
jgi:succinate dehydrogenase / fumarate reductase flavoprotein subunit/fumarate reductase (CoM/CoB) subunit A